MGWLTGWAKREAITVGGGTADVTNFTKLVILTADATRADALATGFDIRFTASDGTTTLFYKREAWSGGGGANVTAIFKVLVPSIAQAGGATIYMYWGNAAAGDVSTTSNCWKAALVDAWDMRDGANNASIYGDKGNTGTKKAANEPVQAAGKIGVAQNFDGSNDEIKLGTNAALMPTSQMCVAAWLNSGNQTGFAHIYGDYAAGGYMRGMWCALNVDEKVVVYTKVGAESHDVWVSGVILDIGVWTHVCCVFDGTQKLIYKNGAFAESKDTTDGSLNWTGFTQMAIGRSGATYPFKGLIDDVRIYSEALTPAEIEYIFGEVNEAGNRCTFGGVEYASSRRRRLIAA